MIIFTTTRAGSRLYPLENLRSISSSESIDTHRELVTVHLDLHGLDFYPPTCSKQRRPVACMYLICRVHDHETIIRGVCVLEKVAEGKIGKSNSGRGKFLFVIQIWGYIRCVLKSEKLK